MKNHSKDKEDARTYILSYEVVDDKITIKLASGEKYTIPFTEENEDKVIHKMEEQARSCPYPKFTNEQFSLRKEIIASGAIVLPFFTLGELLVFIHSPGISSGIGMMLYGLCSAFCITGALYDLSVRRDAKRLNYFIENKRELNDGIEESENIKLGLSKKTIKEIEKAQSEEKDPINIVNLDNYSLKELKLLKANIERIDKFNFDEEALVAVKVRKRTLN